MGIPFSKHWCLLNEGTARTFRSKTTKASHVQIDDRLLTGDRQVAQVTDVAAMNRIGVAAAAGTTGSRHARPDEHVDHIAAE
jgi:hypothetical protein